MLIWFFKAVDGLLGQFYDYILGTHVSGIGFITAIILVFLAGIISTNVFGKKILFLLEKGLLHIPVFKGIYNPLKQTVDAFSPENKSSFKTFVIVEYPRPGVYSFGFLTKECCIRHTGESEICLKAVYIPTNHLYLGEIALFKAEDVIYPKLSVDDGIKIILSGGIATPDYLTEAPALKEAGTY
ncbi:MAG: DUF502 domain-containing protein [Nitrospirae bacterium]|nr:DUF502 domain-containing protein [Nitrospirota bacterium]